MKNMSYKALDEYIKNIKDKLKQCEDHIHSVRCTAEWLKNQVDKGIIANASKIRLDKQVLECLVEMVGPADANSFHSYSFGELNYKCVTFSERL